MRKIIAAACGALLVGAAPAAPQRFCRSLESPRCAAAEFAYGKDRAQRLDYYPARSARRPPLMLFIHGGGWNSGDKRAEALRKPAFFTGRGIAFAAINYRLVPRATVEEQVADIARGIAWLRANADRLDFDPDQILLSGHSAGAQLAALVSTDPSHLRAAGVPLRVIRGAILLDGSGYDIARQLSRAEGPARNVYDRIFGDDPSRHAELSPISHVELPNARAFLIFYVTTGDLNGDESTRFADALRGAGTPTHVVGVPASNHVKINSDFGLEGDAATEEAARFIRQVLPLRLVPRTAA